MATAQASNSLGGDGAMEMAGEDAFARLWRFSLDLYKRDGVAPACLALQDGAGVDVNVMLFLLFAARAQRALDSPDVARIAAAVEGWRDAVVAPLRGARRFLREPPSMTDRSAALALRETLKRAELEAERLEQQMLATAFPLAALGRAEAGAPPAQVNLDAYEAALRTRFEPGARAAVLAGFAAQGDQPT